jgi:hypothetical protein
MRHATALCLILWLGFVSEIACAQQVDDRVVTDPAIRYLGEAIRPERRQSPHQPREGLAGQEGM